MSDPTPKNNQYRVTPENVVEILRNWSLGESRDGVGREGDILNCAADRIEALEAENASLKDQLVADVVMRNALKIGAQITEDSKQEAARLREALELALQLTQKTLPYTRYCVSSTDYIRLELDYERAKELAQRALEGRGDGGEG